MGVGRDELCTGENNFPPSMPGQENDSSGSVYYCSKLICFSAALWLGFDFSYSTRPQVIIIIKIIISSFPFKESPTTI